MAAQRYETIVIMKTAKTDRKTVSILKNCLATILPYMFNLTLGDQGDKNLAYVIQSHKQGRYYVLKYEAQPTSIPEIERELRQNDDVLKFLTMKHEETEDFDVTNPVDLAKLMGNSEHILNKDVDAWDVIFGLSKYNRKEVI